MEKSKLLKVFLVVVVSIALTLTSVQTFAATNFIDITNEATTDTNAASENTNTNTGSTNTNTNSASNTNSSANTNRNTLANTSTNRNGSSYNNTNLPSTGLAETGSIVCIIFALVVSAIYAFKKIRDYNNI